MEAIILAGGIGSRLRSIIKDVPKPMALVDGKPFLEIILDNLNHAGFTKVILSVGYLSNVIVYYFGDNYKKIKIEYAVENKRLGTGGAIKYALQACSYEYVFVFNGDTFLDLEIDALDQHWHQNQRPVIVARHVPDTARYGRLLVAKGRVTGFTEKGENGFGLINAGCYVFNRGQLDGFALNQAFSLELDYLAKVVSESPFDVFVTSGQFIDIGVPEDYRRAQNELAMR